MLCDDGLCGRKHISTAGPFGGFSALIASLLMVGTQAVLVMASELDRDQDGISDSYEHELAQALSPTWVFDSRENSREPDEPLTLYQVHPYRRESGEDAKILSVLLTYAYLFRWDGGYPLSYLCGDAHVGDNQDLKIRVDIDQGSPGRPRVRGMRLSSDWIGPPLLQLEDESHPRIYLSAGKHHPSPRIWFEPSYSPFSAWQCRDVNDGLGDEVRAQVERGGMRLNVGESGHPLITDLTGLGYPNEDAWGPLPFCGGLRSKVGRAACRATSTRSNRRMWQ